MNAARQCEASFLAFSLLLSFAACSRREAPSQRNLSIEKTRPLSEVPLGDQHFSNYKPANPYAELASGILTRTVFEASGPTGYRVEVRDIEVDPKKRAESLRLPGAAFIEVLYGRGVVVIGRKRDELPPGTNFSVPEGQTFMLESTSEQPLLLRAKLVKTE